MKIGYINEIVRDEKRMFEYVECNCTRKITSKSNKLYSERFYPLDFDEVMENTMVLLKANGWMWVKTPVFVDEETESLRDKMKHWVEWANSVDEEEFDPFAVKE